MSGMQAARLSDYALFGFGRSFGVYLPESMVDADWDSIGAMK